MELFPAIDLLGGRCVRLYQGDYDRETVYHDDPVAQARQFADAGATWIHVVDLDAARTGDPVNRSVIATIAASVDARVQTGGGIRDEDSVDTLLECGVARVVLGTAAFEQPALVHRLARDRPLAVGLDERDGEIAIRGWAKGSGRTAVDLMHEFADAGVEAFIVTEIGRDGTLEGPDVDGLGNVLAVSEVPVIASGGVGTLDDLRTLDALERDGRRLAGAIVGRALYEGKFDMAAALAAVGDA